jgi:multidrug efflux pump subunit AcrB
MAIRKRVGIIPDAENLSYGVRTPFGKPVSVSLFGNDLHQLELAKNELKAQLVGLKDVADVITSDQKGYKEIDIELNERAKQLGLTLSDVMRQVRQGFFGHEVQRLQRGEDEVKVWVRYADEGRTSLDDLGKMRIRTADGGSYPLSELTTHKVERGLLSINRLYGKREVRIEGDIAHAGVSATDVMARIEDEFLPPILAKYPNVTYGFEGQAAESRKVGASAGKALPIMFLLMVAIIVITFRSFSQAFMVVFMIPFGLMGVVLGHWMHAAVISLFSFFGIIALIGVMVNDSIVLIETLNMYLQEGKRFADALREAAISRFRPIMLTSVTTIAGLGPLILEKSFQAQFLVPMAIAVAYGLAAATFITLVLLPLTLSLFNDLKQYLLWLWEGQRPTPEEVEPAVQELKHSTDV